MEMELCASPPKKRKTLSDLTLTLTLSPNSPQHSASCPEPSLLLLKPEDRGLRLIQLLLACASHVAAGNLSRADTCLYLVSFLSSPNGDSMQRLSSRLAFSLGSSILRRRLPGLLSAVLPSRRQPNALAFARALPYVPFIHTATARTLVRFLVNERVIHVVDLGATAFSVDLWGPFLRILSRLHRDPPHLKLTCVSGDQRVLDSLGSALVKDADTLDVPFRFHAVNSTLAELDLDNLQVRSGEALAVVSLFKLHELLACETKKMSALLSCLRGMRPRVMVLGEQEAEHTSDRVTERFVEALHHYSSVFDSVEAAAAMGAVGEDERWEVEEAVGREIENVVAGEGKERVERHERAARWAARMERAGFGQGRLWGDAVEESRRVVEAWPGGGGYGLVLEQGCLMICWHDRPLYAVSAWHS